MKVTLIFPPATDPRSPYLALPSLAAVLRAEGVETELLDLSLDGMLALLHPDCLAAAGRQLREKLSRLPAEQGAKLQRLAGLADVLPERAQGALRALRDPERFYDANTFNASRETIFNCLDQISAAASVAVHYNIFPISYDVDGVEAGSLADLIRVTGNRDANLFADYWESEVYPWLNRSAPDLVGITITNRQQIIPGLALARALRQRGHFVVIGGAVYTKFAERLAALPAFFEHFADGVVVYEGETAILELVQRLQMGRDLSGVPNYLCLRGAEVRSGPTHVENLAALPTPDFAGLPLARYLTPEPVLPILHGKGCYFNRCKFCDIPYSNRISRKPYRVRPAELIVADVLELHRRFGCRHFEFTDETLAPALLRKLAAALEPYRARDLGFAGYARLEPAYTPELCQTLARMGVKKLFFGLESASQQTLDHMDKGIRVADAPAVLKNCRDAGINFHIFSIVGFPEETQESAQETFRFFEDNAPIIDHPGNSFDIHPFGLEFRTRYAAEAAALGIQFAPGALAAEFDIGVGERWTNTRGLSSAQVTALLDAFHLRLRRIYRTYHASPQHLWPAFEEFAVLYAGRYRGRAFPYATTLPDATDPAARAGACRLRWNPAALVECDSGGQVRISSRYGEAWLSPAAFTVLGGDEFRPVPELLAQLGASDSAGPEAQLLVRQRVGELFEAGLLQLEGNPEPVEQKEPHERFDREYPEGVLVG